MNVKFFFIALIAFGVWQNWDRINPPDFSHIPEGEIVMYSKGFSELGDQARKAFIKYKVPFEEYDIEYDEKGKRDYKKFNTQSFPVIVYGDYVHLGYGEKAMLYILNERYPK